MEKNEKKETERMFSWSDTLLTRPENQVGSTRWRGRRSEGHEDGHEWRGGKRGTGARNEKPVREGGEGEGKVALTWPCVLKSQNKPAQAKTIRALLARGASVSSEHATHTIKNKMQASARAGWRAQMSVFERCRMGGKGCASVCAPCELVGPRGGLPCSRKSLYVVRVPQRSRGGFTVDSCMDTKFSTVLQL